MPSIRSFLVLIGRSFLLLSIGIIFVNTRSEAWMSSSTTNPAVFRLAYVTDVEGNLDYVRRFVAQVRPDVLRIAQDDETTFQLDLCGDNSYFVYGGDVMDKGPGDIRWCRALVNLKRRYPDRVVLLVGNRDLNKLRLTAELSLADLQRSAHEIPPPHWDPAAPTLLEFLQEMAASSQQTSVSNNNHPTPTNPSSSGLDPWNTRVNRLHYMLRHTLGCPQTFDFRRKELSLLQNVSQADITDDHVVDNFLYEVEQGSLADYLALADVAVCVGNTLFCHGAVDRATMRYVPRSDTRFELPQSPPPAGSMVDSVQEWTAALNTFLREGLDDYQARPHWNSERTSRGGEALMALQNRPAVWGRSIVSNCYGDGGCITTAAAAQERQQRLERSRTDPLAFEKVCSDPMDPVVAEWLLKSGIQRVVVGHKPTGDCPAVLSALYTGVEVVSADTSYSDTSDTASHRGVAATAVHIVGISEWDNQLMLRGILRDGQSCAAHHARLHPDGIDTTLGDVYLGTQLIEGEWWVKSKVTRQEQDTVEPSVVYHLTRGKGRRVEYTTMSTVDVTEKRGTSVGIGGLPVK